MSDAKGDSLPEENQALLESAGIGPLAERTRLRMSGNDRASFLHNLCTNDIKRLQPGQGCEAFITNVQGNSIGHVCVFCAEDCLELSTVPGQGELLLNHLDRYLITEDVALEDLSTKVSEFLIAGPRAEEIVKSALNVQIEDGLFSHAKTSWEGSSVRVARVPILAADAFLVATEQEASVRLAEAWVSQDVNRLDLGTLETSRIENGFPWFGVDFSDSQLPQEVDRNEIAISFTKGCYLGQETVARLDALGHVNKKLTRITWQEDASVQVGMELTQVDKSVGQVTSVAYSRRLGQPIGLAIVRCSAIDSNRPMQSAAGPCQVLREQFESK